MLDKEFYYFVNHQKELVRKFEGKFLVIKGEQVIGVYDDIADAYFEPQKLHELGTFLIQQCLPGTAAYTVVQPFSYV